MSASEKALGFYAKVLSFFFRRKKKDLGRSQAVLVQGRRAKWILRLEREIEEHGYWRLLLTAAVLITFLVGLGWVLGGLRSPTFSYFSDWTRACSFSAFGGEQEINDTTQIYDSLKHWDNEEYNQMDVAATSLFAFPTLIREQMEQVVSRPGGRVRILVLDPRLADTPAGRERLGSLAKQFGQDPFCLVAECRYSAASLIELKKKLGATFEVRFYNGPDGEAAGGFFLPGRSYHKYNSSNPSERLDVIVPYVPQGPEAAIWGKGAIRVKDRPEHPQVKRFTEALERLWSQSAPIEELMAETRGTLHGEWEK